MRLLIAAVGKLGRGPERDLIDAWTARLRWPLSELEIPAREAESREQESLRLVRALPDPVHGVLLDERGEALTSTAFARRLEGWLSGGAGAPVAFLIGGADGHGQAARSLARASLSLGPLTLPHRLARVVLAEQIYRAQTILDGHPYHR